MTDVNIKLQEALKYMKEDNLKQAILSLRQANFFMAQEVRLALLKKSAKRTANENNT